jgi:serine/threonine protein kinase
MNIEVSDIALPMQTVLADKYRIEEVHYLGHTGIVYFGVNIRDSLKVVIKEFIPYLIANRDMDGKSVVCKGIGCQKQFARAREAFDRECEYVQKLKNLSTPYAGCVVTYLDSFEENDTRYLVTEKIEGKSLQDYLESGNDFSMRATVNMLIDIVQQVHKKGIIHCDIKPSNIVLREDGRVVLIDFGSACCKAKKKQNPNRDLMFASRGYSAPELYRGVGIDEKADIYSIGAVLYHMLTDYQLPAPDDYEEKEEIPQISEFIDIPKVHEKVIMKMINRNKKKRPSSLFLLKAILNL